MSERHLIVLEGTDGSGKSTQSELACRALAAAGVEYKRLTFPRYQEDSSVLLRMYLRGDFGSHPGDVNAYAASTFFAVDRYASYKTDWQADYEAGRTIFCDRYTTSNAVHQSSKLEEDQLLAFSQWLFHYEYDLLGLPAPTCVLYLDMPPEISFQMLQKRQGGSGDIHELDHDYLRRCHQRASALCETYGWHRIPCAENGAIRPAEAIHADVMTALLRELGR
ncbi:MAG: deoxynucleoside kinase [Clostridia bacterium]|nr:deoxynucleoside kinase [Clostridia bacterium]